MTILNTDIPEFSGESSRILNIVILDDSRSVVEDLTNQLSEIAGVKSTAFLDPETALAYAAAEKVDLFLIDYYMPKLNGTEVIRRLRAMPTCRYVPIIMITSEPERAIRLEALEAETTDFLSKPVDVDELKSRVGNLLNLRRGQLDLTSRAVDLAQAVDAATEELSSREAEMIMRLAKAIEYRDCGTGEHVSRVAAISALIAGAMGLGAELCRTIYLAAPLHDVGKIGIPDEILAKPGKFTDEERAIMRGHVEIGVEILANGSSNLLRTAERIAGGHHERWDGKGYPKGIAGGLIPIEARIVALADVFEALCSSRPYKDKWPLGEAYDHIVAESGKHFDPACVAAFVAKWSAISALMTEGAADPMSMEPIDLSAIGSSSTEGGETMTINPPGNPPGNPASSPAVLELDRVLTIRQAAALKEKLLGALVASDTVELAIEPDAEADLSFIQLVESARIHAAMHSKRLHLASPAEGQVLETLQRAGLMSGMSSESRGFWFHEKESL
jgi:putative two-component system response regulator